MQELPIDNHWAKITFVFQNDFVTAVYEDGLGNSVLEAGENARIVSLYQIDSIRIDPRIDEFLERLTAGEHDGPIPLYLAYKFPQPLRRLFEDYYGIYSRTNERDFRDLFAPQLLNALEPVVFVDADVSEVPFTMPFEVQLAGQDAAYFEDYLLSTWPRNPENGPRQINISQYSNETDPNKPAPDILIFTDRYGSGLEEIAAREARRTRLFLFATYGNPIPTAIAQKITAIALPYHVDTDPLIVLIRACLQGILSDKPLHRIVHEIDQNSPPYWRPILAASPASNHALRLAHAVDTLNEQMDAYSRGVKPVIHQQFLQRQETVAESIASLAGLRNLASESSSSFSSLAARTFGFSQRKPELDVALHNLQSYVNRPGIFQSIRNTQKRKVDVALETLINGAGYETFYPNAPLIPQATYRLTVQIGQSAAGSLVIGNVDPIDPLLPDPENAKGHDLEVALFPKDFKLLTSSVQPIHLPFLGGSTTARFAIRAPGDKTNAELRLAVFSKNNLLQSFLLKAVVGEARRSGETPFVTVEMDSTNTEKFTNLDELPPRDLYIGVNKDQTEDHTLFLKGIAEATELKGLNETTVTAWQKGFENLLTNIYFNGRTSRFPVDDQPDQHKEAFEAAIRQYIRLGKQIHRKLLEENEDKLDEAFKATSKANGLNILVNRHDSQFSLPWPLIYDYYYLEPAIGIPEYPICYGKAFDESTAALDQFRIPGKIQRGCPHNPGYYTYCLKGFWGIRHQIEQQLPRKEGMDRPGHIDLSTCPAPLLSVNFNDPFSTQTINELTVKYRFSRLTPTGDDLVDLLWDKSKRPAILVVFGHLEDQPKAGEPSTSRILSFEKKDWTGNSPIPLTKWLYSDLLSERITYDSQWGEPPLPLVLLITCDNSGMKLGALGSIVHALYRANCSAIIGTECNITSDLGGLFIRKIMEKLKGNIGLGHAIREFNTELFDRKNPLPFVFTCYGNTDLTIQ
jgi:hypothetical protein